MAERPAVPGPSALRPILEVMLDGRTKGYPPGRPPVRLGEVGRQGWRLLAGDLGTPVALLKASALDANAAWMREFLRRTGASLCPHGKTSMAPQLFHRQLAEGAWGITLATPQEVGIAHGFGVKRILLANQVVSDDAIAWLQRLLDDDPELDFTCLVDGLEGVSRLEAAARGRRPIDVLLELGVPGGRTGARDEATALAVGRAVKASARLRLRGVECFEGIVMSADAAADRARVEAWLDACGALARRCASEGLFETDEVLLTAGGSAYFDLVVSRLSAVDLYRPARVLLRSGCYLFHDTGHYARLVARLEGRLPEAWRVPGGLRPAIEIWGRVLSRPEPGLAFLDFGKRDVAHDLDLPRPLFRARPGHAARPVPLDAAWSVASLYDQHARLALPPGAELAVGDLVGVGVSHPCTTFDKWQLLYVVDDGYRVVDAIRTFF
jgi:D-serine dehydratase